MSLDLLSLISRCTHAKQLRQIHARLAVSGLLPISVFLHNALLRAHSRTLSGSAAAAADAVALYVHLLRCRLRPDAYTFPSLLKSCASLLAGPQGLAAHAHALLLGLDSNLFVTNALIHFYSVFTDLPAARRLLDSSPAADAVSYNSLISGYLRAGQLDRAWVLFEGMTDRDSINWSTMISGCVRRGRSKEALCLFLRMQAQGIDPNDVTLVSVLAACAHLGALEQGKWIHSYLTRKRIKITVFLGTALIDMYAECDQLELALRVFEEMHEKNLLTWTTMIKGLALHGRGLEALRLFSYMEALGFTLDDAAFLSALAACTHAGLVDQGRRIFDSMSRQYGIKPKLEHYGCMVDLLARNGLLYEARDLVESMPMKPNAPVWGALMAGCRAHRNIKLAEHAFEHLLRLEPDSRRVYMLLANVYASAGRHDKARNIRLLMKKKRAERTPGCSVVEIGGRVHRLVAGDRAHPLIKDISLKWDEVEGRIRKEGYLPEKNAAVLNIDEEEKEYSLSCHSERLAIAFALISTEEGMPIRLVKNLRVCTDCHQVTKFISKVYHREIAIRDRTRFHLFKGGSCSCNDYW